MRFDILATEGPARLGRITTEHGTIDTPCFMPVGTQGAVKGLTPEQLAEAGASVMLANLYHLALRPGIDVVERLGGLHTFSGWRRPILTDSGGYQIFSLSSLRSVDDDGVSFRSHLDGEALRLTPAGAVSMQARLGVDMAMMLDECPPWPVSEQEAGQALDRTILWARKAREAQEALCSEATALFGIVQGSFYPRLRERAVEQLSSLDFDGYALGGVSVGEAKQLGRVTVETFAGALPADKPRHLMGVGTPADILHAVLHGVDLFDCVLPSRNARHGVAFTREGPLRLKNARFRDDQRPLDERCPCPACRQVSRAFVHHLIRGTHPTGAVFVTLHNMRFYLDFMARLRQALASASLVDSAAEMARSHADEENSDEGVADSKPTASEPLVVESP